MLNEADVWKCKYVPRAPEVREMYFPPSKGLREGDYVKESDREIMWFIYPFLFFQLMFQVLQTCSKSFNLKPHTHLLWTGRWSKQWCAQFIITKLLSVIKKKKKKPCPYGLSWFQTFFLNFKETHRTLYQQQFLYHTCCEWVSNPVPDRRETDWLWGLTVMAGLMNLTVLLCFN